MKINLILAKVVLGISLFPALASAQSFWYHDHVFGAGTSFVYTYFGVVDSSDCLMSWQSDFQVYTSDYWKSWHTVMEDTPKRPLAKYSYTCFTHPVHNRILIGCNDHSVGHIIRSTDNGTTYTDTSIGSYQQGQPINFITAIAALDSNRIAALISADTYYFPDHLMLSSDGGVNWQSVSTPEFTYAVPSSGLGPNPVISYPSQNTIVVATIEGGEYSTIYRTTNLGLSWDSGFQANTLITKFAFINSQMGFASGTIYNPNGISDTATLDKTTDGGATWFPVLHKQIIPISTNYFNNTAGLYGIAFADSLHGFACGQQGLILQTTDGGNTWNEMRSDYTIDAQGADLLTDVAYPDTNHAMIASSDGSVLVYHPNGILSLPNITYPIFSPPAAPQTYNVTWNPVPNATRYAITITTSDYPNAGDTTIVRDTNVTDTFYQLSNLVDTSPGQPGRQYYIYLQAFNATNESNVATRIFIVYQGTNGVTITGNTPTTSIAVYPNPATSSISITNANGPLSVLDPLGRSYSVPILAGESASPTRLDISSLPTGVYFVSDGSSRAKFVKE